MFTKYQAIFRSRWRAVMWSAGVLLTAYCTVPSSDEKDPEAGMLEVVAASSHHPDKAAKHVNPWALDQTGQKGG